jgi:hypothetical protein
MVFTLTNRHRKLREHLADKDKNHIQIAEHQRERENLKRSQQGNSNFLIELHWTFLQKTCSRE